MYLPVVQYTHAAHGENVIQKNALNLPANAFEFVDKRGDLLKNVLFPGQVLWVERVHLRQDGIQFRAVITGKFAFDRSADVALCGFGMLIFSVN